MKSTIALRQPVWLCNEIDPKVSCNRELDPRMQNETKPAFFAKSFVETKFSESRRTELNPIQCYWENLISTFNVW